MLPISSPFPINPPQGEREITNAESLQNPICASPIVQGLLIIYMSFVSSTLVKNFLFRFWWLKGDTHTVPLTTLIQIQIQFKHHAVVKSTLVTCESIVIQFYSTKHHWFLRVRPKRGSI